ncbi:MAG: bifunctional (p)ppGpp synthetase/guanosine-3',5'-bis(diphosphate) 3'-pyrophosphohydrolase, partial [Solobacterium sp.]|nr:bifunctional (p)ppGpp synthetase/guanosine-3',5'-bis(diphosphate) 3'-pyrophosphohydrolase [Solobacterium sp.]
RTEEMDAIAENGVAAHWRYKDGTKYDHRAEQKEIEDKLSWFKNFAIYSEEENPGATASEYMETLQHDVFEANVYVMTPMGRVIDLPSGATPIDFAYRIHTDVGHTTVGAIVNDAMVPLNTELHTGDVVQIKTLKGTGPSEDWLKIVKTNQAKTKIRSYLMKKETEQKAEKVPEGEKALADELRKRGFDAKEYMEKKKLEAIFKDFRVTNYIDLMYGIAVKSINPTLVVEKLTPHKGRGESEALSKLMNREAHHNVSSYGIIVPGIESMKMSLAHCCMPVYGDEISGYITKGQGVKVHRKDCTNLKAMDNRYIPVEWDNVDNERLYDSDLIVLAHDRNFLLTDIVTVISQCKAPMESVSATVDHEKLTSTVKITLRVHDVEHVNNVIANVRKIESVISVERKNQ